MRVLMIAQFYAPVVGGEERMVEELARALTARGHEVAVATLRSPGLPDVEVRDGVRIHRLPGLAARLPLLFSDGERRHAPPAPDPETVRALAQVVRAERPDVVHGHNWLAHAYLPLRARTPAAYVLSLHDYSLVCATKRLVRRGEPCSGPGLEKCVRCASAQYGPLVGPPTAGLTRVMGQAQRRAADVLLPVSDAVAEACGLPDRPHALGGHPELRRRRPARRRRPRRAVARRPARRRLPAVRGGRRGRQGRRRPARGARRPHAAPRRWCSPAGPPIRRSQRRGPA